MSNKEASCRLHRVIALLLRQFEFRPRIQGAFGGGTELGAQFRVAHNPKKVDEFSVDVVVDFNLRPGCFANRTAAEPPNASQ
jgi:hypothetical protein